MLDIEIEFLILRAPLVQMNERSVLRATVIKIHKINFWN